MTTEQKNIQTFIHNIASGEFASAQKTLEQCIEDKLKSRVSDYTQSETFKKFNAGE
jgi:hypothetical protein